MKIFFYKSVLIFLLFLLGFHLTYNYVSKEIERKIKDNISKESVEIFKTKIREEMNNAINKESFLKSEDAILINKFLEKIKSDLQKNLN